MPLAHACWRVEAGSRAAIEQAASLLAAKAAIVSARLDRQRLESRAWQLTALRDQATDSVLRANHAQRLRLVMELLEGGVAAHYAFGRTGRLTTHQLASPLTTSRKFDRYGYDFWCALALPFWMVDIRAADLLYGSIVAGDEALSGATSTLGSVPSWGGAAPGPDRRRAGGRGR